MMPALRADPQGLLELFVPVVGVAARAGVRVLGRVLRGRAAVLDRNVDPARHGRLSYGVARYRPSAAQTLVSAGTFAGSGVRPVRPTPATGFAEATFFMIASVSTSVSPPGSGKNDATSSSGSRTSESNATYTASTAASALRRPFSPV